MLFLISDLKPFIARIRSSSWMWNDIDMFIDFDFLALMSNKNKTIQNIVQASDMISIET